MGVPPDSTPYGSQTVMGPGWPNVDEEQLTAAAEQYEQLAMHLTGTVVPQLQGQWTNMSNSWSGAAATAALGEASTIISGHEMNAAQAQAIAMQLHAMAAAVTQTKAMVNATAQEIQHMCEAIEAMPIQNKEELLQSAIKLGQSQNMADVSASTGELASQLGVPAVNPAGIPIPPGGVPGAGQASKDAQEAGKTGGQGGQQIMQMMSGMVGQIGQVPQQLSKMVSGQGLQQLTQPLQQISSMFGQLGKGGGGGAGGAGASPFAAFSNHPAAGGSGPKAGGGLMHGASVPGSGGSSPRTPLMAKLVDKHTTVSPTAVEEGAVAGSTATAGAAPVAAGGAMGGMGGMGMMGHRESSGGSRAGLAVPTPLDHDLSEDEGDDDW
ncbi:hypothetical protein [Mycobacterium celatum]|uniref:PPE family protein n=1 Tax=Mycobacterium celatum TaxID=28045 RepID=A0A1X1RU62_MYCCE|nr:hypothetical protein [Mycobacterium celatum]ORV18001.1 hypothetical protein AWB95_04020 [Mycobacterium celatum]PIB80404.1 hypothetical protein CQY23_02265 [Mycobacterium celatum]